MNNCIQKTEIPEWVTKGKTTLIQNNQLKGTAPTKCRPIRCLPMIWKRLTTQISEICNSLISRRIFHDE